MSFDDLMGSSILIIALCFFNWLHFCDCTVYSELACLIMIEFDILSI